MTFHNTAEGLLAAGRELFDRGDYEGANLAFVNGMGLQPDNPLFHYWNGLTESRLGRFELEVAAYDKAIRLSPLFRDAYFTRGFANLRRGNFHGAIIDYTTVASLDPQLAATFKADISRAWAGRGEEFRRAGDTASALGLLSVRYRVGYIERRMLPKSRVHILAFRGVRAGNW